MHSYMFLITFSILWTVNFKEYKKTKRIYNLLLLIPITGAIILSSPIKKYISCTTDIILSIIVCIIYIIILLLDGIDRRKSNTEKG